MTGTKVGDFSWWLPMYGAAGAIILALPQLIFGNDVGSFLLTIVLAALIGLILLVVAFRKARRHGLAVLAMMCVFLALAWSLNRSSEYLRTTIRWLVHSQSYKTQISSQPIPSDGSLKHIEWDGWGFAGAGDTTVYLVFDPNDSLAPAAKSQSLGKFSGLPCEVYRVRRLESEWYTVQFYTDTDWNYCGARS
jgi:hypothetical protein